MWGFFANLTLAMWVCLPVALGQDGSTLPPDAVVALQRAGEATKVGDLKTALEFYEKCNAILAEGRSNDLKTRGAVLSKIADVLGRLRRQAESFAAYEQALDWLESSSGTIAEWSRNTRLSYVRSLIQHEDYTKAEALISPFMVDSVKSDLPDAFNAKVMTTLGLLYMGSYRWNDASLTLEAAVEQCEEHLDSSDPELARAHNAMGRISNRLGSSQLAVEHLQVAVEIYSNANRKLDHINAQINLGQALILERQFSKAIAVLRIASEEAKELPDQRGLVAQARNQFAHCYFEKEDFTRAARYHALALKDATASDADLSLVKIATAYNNRSISQLLTGDLEGAGENIEIALKTLPPASADLSLLEERFSAQFNHAMLLFHQGKQAAAVAAAREAIKTLERSYRELSYFPPEVRLHFSQRLIRYPFYLAGTLEDADFAMDVALKLKDLVAESVAKDRSALARLSVDPTKRGLVDQLAKLEREFATASLRGADIKKIKTDIRRLRAGLLKNTSATREPETKDLLEALGEGEVVLEFFEFRGNRAAEGWSRDIGVLLLQKDTKPMLYVIPEDKVELLQAHLEELRGRVDSLGKRGSKSLEGDPVDWSEEVFEILLGPARHSLAKATTITICTDGAVHRVPFAVLQDQMAAQRGPLIATHDFRYINSLRDLLAPPNKPSLAEKRALMVGSPDYLSTRQRSKAQSNKMPEGNETKRAIKVIVPPGSSLSTLEGSGREVKSLTAKLRTSGYKVAVLVDKEPTEEKVRELSSQCSVLHFSTHGFYFGTNTDRPAGGFLEQVENPMYLAGLAFVGAGRTFGSWSRKQFPDTETDGVFMASELAALDLRRTDLVVLSACDTAKGKVVSGQGIQGFRRALTEAGCQNVITTLWSIDDRTTVGLMESFYDRYLKGDAPHVAMSASQRELFKAVIKSENRWKAIFDVAPFVVTSRGRLTQETK
ncbi:MAG: CHAT domain-containing protein/tetratricopeptide (TPR) repeat protein [Verrucomicrobiales bacterium]|jgi:CHAT domain-containing protein/tetratricopeptide (TPR) repeat protein